MVDRLACPCGSGAKLAACCLPLVSGDRPASSAEALMRSRYTAYTLGREDYLLDTWHPRTRPESLDLTADPPRRWLGLDVRRHEFSPSAPDRAIVEFVARFRVGWRGFRLHETSNFVREDGRWLYVDGDMH